MFYLFEVLGSPPGLEHALKATKFVIAYQCTVNQRVWRVAALVRQAAGRAVGVREWNGLQKTFIT